MKKLLTSLLLTLSCCVAVQAVTLTVNVPEGTVKCFVCGAFNDWDVTNAPQLTSSGENQFTISLPDVSEADLAKGYKYTNGQDWKYVEKDKDGGEIDNRTSYSNPDVVESWASLNLWDIKNVSLTVNGLPRQISIYLPKGYEDSSETYPVIYYNTVQQRYSNAGADDDNGDNFFGTLSWNAQATMENLRADGGKAYILVQICSMLGENTMSANEDYKGTGGTAAYLDAFAKELMPYIEKNYRVKTGKENTTIVGADYGALFSLYAAVKRPDLFGNSVVMSPMLWINDGDYEALASQASEGQNYYVSVGAKEPEWIIAPTENLADCLKESKANVYFDIYSNAAHNDDDWGLCFPYVLEGLSKNSAPTVGGNDSSLLSETYVLYAGDNKTSLQKIGVMEYTDQYTKKQEKATVPAVVCTYIIPADYHSSYYWNIEIGEGSGNWVKSEPGSVGFNANRNETAWHNIALHEDMTTTETAAHSKGFRVVVGNATTNMTSESEYIAKATVKFGDTKDFEIRFGSVNSNSEQKGLTAVWSVSNNCTEAEITYDFHLNRITVKETQTGESQETPLPDFKSRTYTLYGGEAKDDLKKVEVMTYTDDFRKTGSDSQVSAYVYTNDIPAENKSYYYWNIAIGDGTDNWVFSSPKNVSFSDKKNATSWHTIAVFEDGSTSDIAAHSEGFRVVAGQNTTMMTNAGNHQAKVTLPFPGKDKTFQVNYGSVNSSSDMGAITPKLSVSPQCLEAEITYNFSLNKVSVVETKIGEPSEALKVTEFSAVPSVALAGSDVNVRLALNKAAEVKAVCTNLSGASVPVSITRTGNAEYSLALNKLPQGIYTIELTLTEGDNVLTNPAPLNIIVLADTDAEEKEMTVNAYKDIDWSATGMYKANFHTHTSISFDTEYTPTQVVDKYQGAGYQILALTDHDANPYPWSTFSLYNPESPDRDVAAMGMLSIPGNELSKDRRNNWSESTGGEFNHHNDFFTGRKGQEFMSLRESYAYSQAIGGLQIINHPGQYWNLSNEYKNGEKNSPEWHAENFRLYDSLIGLEVYNQGNRRPNDRILWDQILTITMPQRPVWGYSCDDTHTSEQYFRNYQYMLMPDLSVEALKEAMKGGNTIFSYEFTGSGKALAPHIASIDVDTATNTITIDTDDADMIEWIYSTYRTGSTASTTKSAVVGYGKTFDFSNYQGSYVRARLTNEYGETATQPFGFDFVSNSSVDKITVEKENALTVINNPGSDIVTLICTEPMQRISVMNAGGAMVRYLEVNNETNVSFNKAELPAGVYVIVVATERAAYTGKILK